MRRFDIVLTDATSGNVLRRWNSHSDAGIFNPGAPLVEFDITVNQYGDAGAGNDFIRIWGIPIQDISYARQLFPKPNASPSANISVSAGMASGLPLASASQYGPITFGIVAQSFGNWQGTNQFLDILLASSIPVDLSANPTGGIVFSWKKGTLISDAIKSCLSLSYPKKIINISIQSITATEDHYGIYKSLDQLALTITQLTAGKVIIPKSANAPASQAAPIYDGVKIIRTPSGGFSVFDALTATAPKAISFVDLVGQPTWVNNSEAQLQLIMRSDIGVGDIVSLPSTQVTQNSLTRSGDQSGFIGKSSALTFTGNYRVISVRHVGNSKSPDGSAWVTIINCIPA